MLPVRMLTWSPDQRPRLSSKTGSGTDAASAMAFERARIGVELGVATEVDGRTGVRVRDAEDGGPAARAGLRAGDVLVSLDGAALGDDPASRLIELLSDVEPGDTVAVGYLRDGREQTARVVTDRARGFSVYAPGDGEMGWRTPRIEPLLERVVAPDAHVRLRSFFGGGGVELVEMNDGLGEYFGTDEGVLVADVDEDASLGLRPGDVILTIGGRAVRDPGHARSIIASYREDETISFEVMRERRRTTVTGTRAER